jgi:hypothetical protein
MTVPGRRWPDAQEGGDLTDRGLGYSTRASAAYGLASVRNAGGRLRPAGTALSVSFLRGAPRGSPFCPHTTPPGGPCLSPALGRDSREPPTWKEGILSWRRAVLRELSPRILPRYAVGDAGRRYR